MGVIGVYLVIRMRRLNTYSSNAALPSIWSTNQVASNLYPSTSVANIFGNWIHDIDVAY
jgi:hypothetical protein